MGLIWNTEKDEFQVDVKVNFSGKRGGVHTAPNIDLDKYLADKVWLGLLAPYTIKLKAVMRELCSKEGAEKKGWDDPAPPQTVENFHNAISGLGS